MKEPNQLPSELLERNPETTAGTNMEQEGRENKASHLQLNGSLLLAFLKGSIPGFPLLQLCSELLELDLVMKM